MGIILETVTPNRRLLIQLACWRFMICGIFLAASIYQFSQPSFDNPGHWLFFASLWITLMLICFVGGLYPLCFLTRFVRFYENGISAEPFEIPLEELKLVHWKRKPFRILGLFVLRIPYQDCMLCILNNNKRKISISGYYFPGLRDAFDRAYEHSIPWEFTSKSKLQWPVIH